jgi:glutaredoxin
MITAVLYGREKCGICKSAADKLKLLDVPFKKEDIDKFIEVHEGWQSDDSIEVLTAMCKQNKNIPVIKLDLGDGQVRFTSYPEAMAILKERLGNKGHEQLSA